MTTDVGRFHHIDNVLARSNFGSSRFDQLVRKSSVIRLTILVRGEFVKLRGDDAWTGQRARATAFLRRVERLGADRLGEFIGDAIGWHPLAVEFPFEHDVFLLPAGRPATRHSRPMVEGSVRRRLR